MSPRPAKDNANGGGLPTAMRHGAWDTGPLTHQQHGGGARGPIGHNSPRATIQAVLPYHTGDDWGIPDDGPLPRLNRASERARREGEGDGHPCTFLPWCVGWVCGVCGVCVWVWVWVWVYVCICVCGAASQRHCQDDRLAAQGMEHNDCEPHVRLQVEHAVLHSSGAAREGEPSGYTFADVAYQVRARHVEVVG